MSAATAARQPSSLDAVRRLFRDRPVVPLTGLLVLLVVVMAIASPGIVTPSWAGVILRTAVPLAILAGCQTLTMLTGGIDLSVGAVASMVRIRDGHPHPLPGRCTRGDRGRADGRRARRPHQRDRRRRVQGPPA